MRTILTSIAALAIAVSVSACGGGSSSPTPTKVPFVVHVKQIGGGANGSVTAGFRRVPLAATVGSNIVLLAASDPLAYNHIAPEDTSTVVEATVVPTPPQTLTPSWTPAATGTSVSSLTNPPASPSPAVYDEVVRTTGGPTNGSLTVSFSEITATVSPQVIVYPRINLACNRTDPANTYATGGVSFVNGAVVAQTDPALSDIYISGPNCPGKFKSLTEIENTLHYPGGGTTVPYPTPFNTMIASNWVNTQTSNTGHSMIDNGALNVEWVIRTTTSVVPAFVKISFGSVQPGTEPVSTVGTGFMEGAACVFGACIDGT